MATVKTAVLIAAMTALFLGAGWLLGGQQGAIIAFVAAAAMNGWAYWNSDKAVLRQQGARRIPPGDGEGLHAMTEQLARNAGLPMPALYLIDTPQPNAFATGRNPDNAAVAVIVISSVSRFLMCASSCAMTPATSSRDSDRRRPAVTATAALSGFRPVAKAFGWAVSIR